MTCSPFAIACQEWPDLNLLALTGKRPVEKNWSHWCSQPQAPGYRHGWAKSSIAYNVGVALGFNGLVAIDIDTDDLTLIRSIIAVLPPIRAAKRGRRGFTAFFRDPTGNIETARLSLVEILARGTQTVLPPSIHPDTGKPFIWLDTGELTAGRYIPLVGLPDLSVVATIATDDVGGLHRIVAKRTGQPGMPRRLHGTIPGASLSEQERERQRRYFEPAYRSDLAMLAAMLPNSGRNRAAFRFICRFARWAHAGIISADRVTADMLEVCRINGLVSEDGTRAVLATIASAMRKSANDPLPDLRAARYRHG